MGEMPTDGGSIELHALAGRHYLSEAPSSPQADRYRASQPTANFLSSTPRRIPHRFLRASLKFMLAARQGGLRRLRRVRPAFLPD